MSVYFKTSDTKTSIDSDKISVEIFSSLEPGCCEITIKFYANQGLN